MTLRIGFGGEMNLVQTRVLPPLLAVAMATAGCATAKRTLDQVPPIELGMSEAEVVTAWGRPRAVTEYGNFLILHYSWASYGRWFVRLTEGKADRVARDTPADVCAGDARIWAGGTHYDRVPLPYPAQKPRKNEWGDEEVPPVNLRR